MRSYASDSTVEAYLVPMESVNRLVLFVTLDAKWTMDEKYRIVRTRGVLGTTAKVIVTRLFCGRKRAEWRRRCYDLFCVVKRCRIGVVGVTDFS